MKKQIIRTMILALGFILTINLFASTPIGKDVKVKDGKKPVDEGVKVIVKEDRIKGSTIIKTTFTSSTLSLSKEKKDGVYQIKIPKASHIPITCQVMRGDKEIFKLEDKKSSNIIFNINTSILKVGDKVTISNRYKAIGKILITK